MSHRCVGQGMRKGFSGVPSGPATTHYVIQRCLAPQFLSCSRVLCVAKKKFSLVSPLLSSSLHAHTCSSVYLLASENRAWEYGYFLGELKFHESLKWCLVCCCSSPSPPPAPPSLSHSLSLLQNYSLKLVSLTDPTFVYISLISSSRSYSLIKMCAHFTTCHYFPNYPLKWHKFHSSKCVIRVLTLSSPFPILSNTFFYHFQLDRQINFISFVLVNICLQKTTFLKTEHSFLHMKYTYYSIYHYGQISHNNLK